MLIVIRSCLKMIHNRSDIPSFIKEKSEVDIIDAIDVGKESL